MSRRRGSDLFLQPPNLRLRWDTIHFRDSHTRRSALQFPQFLFNAPSLCHRKVRRMIQHVPNRPFYPLQHLVMPCGAVAYLSSFTVPMLVPLQLREVLPDALRQIQPVFLDIGNKVPHLILVVPTLPF